MAHEISYVRDRWEIAYAGATPWHGLGMKLDGLQTPHEMIRAAGLDWQVEPRELLYRDRNGGLVSQPSHIVLVRSDGDSDVALGVVSRHYKIIQNMQAAEIVDALVAEGKATVEVAGALGQGERCWMLSRLPDSFEVVRGDEVRPYFLLAWGHDGKHGVAGKLTPIRVVCQNTLSAAGFSAGKWSLAADIYIRHYGEVKLQLDEARRALGLMRRQTAEVADVYRKLAAVPLRSPAQYFAAVFPPPVKEGLAPDAEYERRFQTWDELQQMLMQLYEAGAGSQIAAARGSVWAGYNAVTEWADHYYPVLKSGKISTHRQASVLFGHYADVKKDALAKAWALVA